MATVKGLVKVKLTQVLREGFLEADAYLVLSPLKNVKIFNKGEAFLLSEVEKYQERFDQHLYVSERDHLRLLKNFLQDSKRAQNSAPNKATAELAYELQEWGRELADRMELLPELGQTAHLAAEAGLGLLKHTPELAQMLKLFFQKRSYLSEHSLAVSLVSTALALALGQRSKGTLMKLALASFFHDITLKNDQAAMVENLEQCEHEDQLLITELGLPTQKLPDLEEIKNHPLEAAKLVMSLEKDLLGLEEILKHHHETPSGDGFPYELGHRSLSALTALFIVAHDFVKQSYLANNWSAASRKEIILGLEKKYHLGSFASVSAHLPLIFRPAKKG